MAVSKPKALHFGAGNIGRGFIGPLLVDSCHHVVFVDIDKGIINALNERRSYNVHVIGSEGPSKHISSVSGLLSQSDDVIHQLADPNVRIMTTAVGPNVLFKLAPTIAKGIQARRKADAGSLNIIACENMVGQTTALYRCVSEHLPSEDQTWADHHVGFANCSVDRIVPPGEPKRNSLDVEVEEFYEWVVDEAALWAPIEAPSVTFAGRTSTIWFECRVLSCGGAGSAYL